MTNKTRYRTASLDGSRATGDRVPVTVSTDQPVEVDGYLEILSHDPAHVDLRRAPLPLLVTHEQRQLPIGIVDDLHVVGGKLKGYAVFSDRPEAQAIRHDVDKRIIRSVSVGYSLTKVLARAADAITYAWQPFEVSCVSCPADVGAGFYRSKNHRSSEMEEQENTRHVEDDDGTEGSNMTRSQRRAVNRQESDERERCSTISSLVRVYSDYVPNDLANRAISEGRSVEWVKDQIMRRMESGHTNTSVPMNSSEGSEWAREMKGYNFGRAMQLRIDPASAIRAGGSRELEISNELARRLGISPSSDGVMIPDEVLFAGRRGRSLNMGSGFDGDAGGLHAESFRGDLFADAFRANTVVGALGARVLTGQTGDIIIPRKGAVSTMGWHTETGDASQSEPDFNQMVLKPKRVSTYVIASRQATIQSGIDLENLMRDDLVAGQMVEIDRVALSGAGTGAEPRGVVNVSGIGTVVGGDNGAEISYSHLVDLEAACADADATFGSSGFAVNPKTRAYLKKSPKLGTSVTELAWDDSKLDSRGIGAVSGHRAGVTTLLRSNLNKGTSTGVCSEVIFGSDWNEIILARFGGSEIIIDPYSLATTGQIRITLNGFWDVGLRRPGAFAKMSDALTG